MEHPRHKPAIVATALDPRPEIAPAPASGERRRAFGLADVGMGLLALDGRWLSANDALLRSVVALAPVVIWAVDAGATFTLSEGGALAAMGADARRMAVGRSAIELYRDLRVIERGGRSTTGEVLLRRALAGEPAAGIAEIGDARYDITMMPVLGLEGDVAGVVGFTADATERVEAEVRLRQRDRLVAVGTLAAGVAHEIDIPLSSVVRSLDFVSQLVRACAEESRAAEVVPGPSVTEALREPATALVHARESAARVRRIARDLATFARSGSERRSLLDVRAILTPVVNLVSNEIRKRARLVWDLRDVPLVRADEARLGHVFMNLLMNAAQAIPEGDVERHEIGVTTYTDEAGRAVCEVRDTGSGIPADVVSRVFDPFFTTKPGGPSSGLGLSICHGIVTALGGEVSVQSVPGAGSVFRVAIPAATLGCGR